MAAIFFKLFDWKMSKNQHITIVIVYFFKEDNFHISFYFMKNFQLVNCVNFFYI